jgi:hypothetical protein
MIVLTEIPANLFRAPETLRLLNIYVFTALQRDLAQAEPSMNLWQFGGSAVE